MMKSCWTLLALGAMAAPERHSSWMRSIDTATSITVRRRTRVAWATGRVGAELDPEALAPAIPRFAGILTGIVGTGTANGLVVQVAAGTTGSIPTATIELQHRAFGSPTWTTISFPIADGGTAISGYSVADVVEMRARALAPDDTPSLYTGNVTVTIGSSDGAVPTALPADGILISGGLGACSITFVTGSDTATTQVQLYRNTTGTLNRSTDGVGTPLAVEPNTSYPIVDGDATRVNLLANPGFDSGASWSLDANWAIGSGVASHSPGAADDISQSLVLTSGETYRIAYTVDGVTNGEVWPRLSGVADIDGTAVDADGRYLDALVADGDSDAFGFSADTDFDGSIDDAVIYRQTAQCLDQGTVYFWLEPQNENGIPGPVTGPIAATII